MPATLNLITVDVILWLSMLAILIYLARKVKKLHERIRVIEKK